MGQTIELAARDGHRFAAYKALPTGQAKGAILVVQEIFGVNSHIRAVADSYAAEGYVAIAPAFYDRAQRNYETGYTPEDIAAGRAIAQQLNWDNTLKDIDAALEHARASGRVGLVGYCWGGTAAWLAASRTTGLACAVAYYGGGIPNFIKDAPKCPVMLNFGEHDKTPSAEQGREIAAAHPSAITHFYNAGHGFNCDHRASYDAAAAALAKQRALVFFVKHLAAS